MSLKNHWRGDLLTMLNNKLSHVVNTKMRSMFVLMFAAMAMLAVTASSVKVSAQGCTPTWSPGGLMPTTDVRSFGVYFPANGRLYAMGGRADDTAGSDLLNPLEYNPATNTWATKAALYPDNQVNNCLLYTSPSPRDS